MGGLVVCAMAGARHGRGFEPRFVCPSRGPLARPPPPPPSAARSTTGTAGASGGVSPHRFLSSDGLSTGTQQKQGPNHNTPAAARSATGATCGAGTACPPHTPLQRGIEPSSSAQRPAALPLRHAAKSPHYSHRPTGMHCPNG